ncbi:HXXEE domain-containing protein [Pseudonocardia parietis]|uniref:HXXEE domain-containing protein n=1 Tax=Pseudonocardia parietis TaxID=570936 RepID=A0ABS4W4U4_9PSEU|nr:HXXEE domain-containing protein [Pseudonocardia parietis]MBP2370928.1 hypothetical protein [Pseudonocardia parietis]
MTPRRRIPRTVTWGLFAAWLVHDAEELVMMPRWMARARPRLERRFPSAPATLWRRMEPDQAHTALAIGFVGCLVAAAAYDGDRTDGRSPFFQAVLAGFGAHAVPHVGSAVVTGGYTPGLLTAPTVVVPYSLWASRELRRAEVETAEVPTVALACIPLAIGAAHLAAGAALKLLRGRGAHTRSTAARVQDDTARRRDRRVHAGDA